MTQRTSLRRPPLREWGIRLVLAGAAGWVGYWTIVQSLAVALPDSEIERAYSLAPGNGRIAARLSETLSGPEATAADRARAAQVARDALRRDPTAVEAVTTLGLDALLHGDRAAAKRLFAYSQALSRRNLRTQLWAIEDAVARDDIADALKHYDIALRTKRNAPELLYPVLTAAIVDPTIRKELVKTLAAKPIWADSFISYAVPRSPDPKATAELFRELRQARFSVPKPANDALINALLANGRFDEAWSYYSLVRGGADRRRSRDPDFEAMPERPSAFDWVAENREGISTAIQPAGKNGIFDFAVSPSVGGRLLQQLQMLPAGDYVLQGHSVDIDQLAGSRPYWILSCLSGRELGRLEMSNSSEAQGQFTGHFTVPANCPVQVLALVARSSSKITGVTGQIDRALLSPSR